MSSIFIYIAVSFILLHEMDAIRCKEWRIFPLTSFLNDKVGYPVFLMAHLPLYYLVLKSLNNTSVQYGLNIFFIVHLGLHVLFLKHPKNEFTDIWSWLPIIGAAIFGGLGLIS